MRRHHICIGDTTTAGGVVASAASNFTIQGRSVALEGDAIDCRACKSTGAIRCAGPRHHETCGGRRVALEGDLCACGCSRPPELVAGQHGSFQTLGGAGIAPGSSADAGPGDASSGDTQ